MSSKSEPTIFTTIKNANRSVTIEPARPDLILFSDSARGVFIPQHFAETIRRDCVTGLEPDDWTVLETGPDHDLYWDVWIGVCDSAVVTDDHGHRYSLWQNGDLWLVPESMIWNERSEMFEWPDEMSTLW